MTNRTLTNADALVEAFEEHLRLARGINPVSRRSSARYIRMFLKEVFGEERLDLEAFSVPEVVCFMSSLVGRYRPRTLGKVATALRSFFQFLRLEGLRDDRLDEAVPCVVQRRLLGLPRYLDEEQVERLLAVLDESTPRARRDRAIVLCVARLGLRSSEVLSIRLQDLDWRAGVVQIPARKNGHGSVLPLPRDVGQAIVDYIKNGRPETSSRHVFVLHHLRIGEPAGRSVVYTAVDLALKLAGIEAPIRGPHLLRHTLATRLIRKGASLKEIADLLGHRCLESTRVYAKLDLASLRDVAQPWPETTS